MDAAEVVARLGLRPHPEGGHYVETWRADATPSGRPAGTAILFLLAAGEESHWHRVDSTELWHFHAGAPLELDRWAEGDPQVERALLGPDLAEGQSPQLRVDPFRWQAARSTGAWTLVGCTVSPGFEFDGFELAPPGWRPPVSPA